MHHTELSRRMIEAQHNQTNAARRVKQRATVEHSDLTRGL